MPKREQFHGSCWCEFAARIAALNALAIAALYAMSCAAVWTLSRRGAEKLRPKRANLLNFAGIVGTASMLLVIALASWPEIIGLCATILAATLGYLARGLMRRGAAHSSEQPKNWTHGS